MSQTNDIEVNQETANELLLFFLRGKPDESPPAELAQLAEPEWNAVAQQARRYGLAPLLHHRLKNAPHLPASVLQSLRTIYFETAWRNAQLYNELAKVLTALRQAEISVIVLKGAYLAQAVYSNIALRPMCDVDILVRKDDLAKAQKTLLELGYAASKEEAVEKVCARQQHIHPLVKKGAAAVEIHWTLISPRHAVAVNTDGLWARACPCAVAGVEVLTLAPEDLLLHLCLHTQHHSYANIKTFCDIQQTVRHFRDEIDWEAVRLRALQWDCVKPVYFALYIANMLFGAKVPVKVLDTLKPDSFTPQMAADSKKIIFSVLDDKISSNHYLAQLFNSQSVLDAAVLLLKRIFLPVEIMANQYSIPPNSPRILLCYPSHLLDLLIRHSRTVLQFLRRDEATVRQFHLVDWLAR